jgi:hypothetical protein
VLLKVRFKICCQFSFNLHNFVIYRPVSRREIIPKYASEHRGLNGYHRVSCSEVQDSNPGLKFGYPDLDSLQFSIVLPGKCGSGALN